MSRLENTARRVLTPLILGTGGVIEGADLGTISAWTQKTCLTAMYVSTAEDRSAGYGLPASEYHALHAIRDKEKPLPRSQFWIGRFSGDMAWSVRVTPLCVATDGSPEPKFPDGYVMTVVLGQLILQGIRMTTPRLKIRVMAKQEMPRIWPDVVTASWPGGEAVGDSRYEAFALGRDLLTHKPHVNLRPWKPATELPASNLAGDMVELPTICGKHVAYYPAILIREATQSRFYAFMVPCDCGIAYLIHTEPDGAHCKASGDPQAIAELYEAVPGIDDMFTNQNDTFRCKRLA
jgi:hypothetical protein